MAQLIRSSRLLLPLILNQKALGTTASRFLSSAAATSPSPPAAATASSSASSSSIPPPPSPAAAAEAGSGEPPKTWSLLKIGVFTALTAALGATGCATYAYSLDEVGQKAMELNAMANYSIADDASALEKVQAIVFTTAMKVPIKILEAYMDIRRGIEEQVQGFTEPSSEKLLPDLHPLEQHVFTLVLDLNETLVYSDWKRDRGWKTFKRPGVDDFLEHLAKFYEIVVYSDQLPMYVEPILERLDQKGCIRYRLARNATRYQDGKHYRDLSKLNRDPSRILYISGHAIENSLQPENCVPIKPWKLENDDTALLDLLPFLEYVALHRPADIRPVLESYKGSDIASEFIKRSKEHQMRMQEQRQHGRFWRR